jgi:hypothetical protein
MVKSNLYLTVNLGTKEKNDRISQLTAYFKFIDLDFQFRSVIICILLWLDIIYFEKNGELF